MLSEKKDFYFFLPNLYAFYFLFLSDCISKYFQLGVKMIGEKEHSCFFPDLKAKVSSFLSLRIMGG